MFHQLEESLQEEYIEKAYHNLVDSAFLILIDEPIEDNKQYDLICQIAEELYDQEEINDYEEDNN